MYSLYLTLCCLTPGSSLEAAAPRVHVREDGGYKWVRIVMLQDLPIAKEPAPLLVKCSCTAGGKECSCEYGVQYCADYTVCPIAIASTGFGLVAELPIAKEPVKAEPSGKAAYDAAYRQAEQGKLPLVVFVNQPVVPLYGTISCRWDDYPVESKDTVYGIACVVGRGGKELKVFRGKVTGKQLRDYFYPNTVGHDLHMPVPDSFPPGTRFNNGGYIGSDGHYVPPVGRGGLLIRMAPRVYGGR